VKMTLAQIRRELLVELALSDRWRSQTDLADAIGSGGGDNWYKAALVLERLAADGQAELQRHGRVRRYRRKREAIDADGEDNPFLVGRDVRLVRVHPPPRDLDEGAA